MCVLILLYMCQHTAICVSDLSVYHYIHVCLSVYHYIHVCLSIYVCDLILLYMCDVPKISIRCCSGIYVLWY